jgi:hypothetical protein
MSTLDSLRRPEYVGANRCWPCTVVNAVLVLAAAAGLATVSRAAGVAVALVGAALIALRGYVVPYTPTFAPKLVAYLPVDFGPDHDADPEQEPDSLAHVPVDGERLLSELIGANVLVGTEDLEPAVQFVDEWEAEMESLRSLPPADLASVVAERAPSDYEGSVSGDWLVLDDGDRTTWLTRALAISEGAAVKVLVDRGVDREVAAGAAAPLRMFLEHCPACGGPTVETTIEACCGGAGGFHGSPETSVLACDRCDERLFVFGEEQATDAEKTV